MSREFGDDHYRSRGFFHQKIEQAAETGEGGGETARRVAAILRALYPVAYAVSSAEAGDAGQDHAEALARGCRASVREACALLGAALEERGGAKYWTLKELGEAFRAGDLDGWYIDFDRRVRLRRKEWGDHHTEEVLGEDASYEEQKAFWAAQDAEAVALFADHDRDEIGWMGCEALGIPWGNPCDVPE